MFIKLDNFIKGDEGEFLENIGINDKSRYISFVSWLFFLTSSTMFKYWLNYIRKWKTRKGAKRYIEKY